MGNEQKSIFIANEPQFVQLAQNSPSNSGSSSPTQVSVNQVSNRLSRPISHAASIDEQQAPLAGTSIVVGRRGRDFRHLQTKSMDHETIHELPDDELAANDATAAAATAHQDSSKINDLTVGQCATRHHKSSLNRHHTIASSATGAALSLARRSHDAHHNHSQRTSPATTTTPANNFIDPLASATTGASMPPKTTATAGAPISDLASCVAVESHLELVGRTPLHAAPVVLNHQAQPNQKCQAISSAKSVLTKRALNIVPRQQLLYKTSAPISIGTRRHTLADLSPHALL